MSSLIPSYPITDFRKLKAHELKRLKSCEVTSDGLHLFIFVNSATDYIKDQVESFAMLSNSNSGEDLDNIIKEVSNAIN